MERCSISTRIPCFYPRAREGYDRPRLGRTTTAARDFSPRARKLNDDVSAFSLPANPNSFNPHSHAGSDPQGPLLRELPAHFNPHSPCGE